MTKVAVFGAGSWGTAFSLVLADAGHEVTLWGRREDLCLAINEKHENPDYLPGVELPPAVTATPDPARAAEGASLVVLAVPSQTLRANLRDWAEVLPADAVLLSLIKGVETGDLKRMSEVIAEVTGAGPERIAVLTGPNLAKEIAAREPAASVVACTDEAVAAQLREWLHGPNFRPYSSNDVVGCELGGAYKNVIALAVGMAVGLGFGDNTTASVITRGLAEIARLAVRLGADPLTLMGLAGLGDLVATCSSPLSRNRTFGEKLGQGLTTAEITASTRQVAEGVKSCGSLLALAQRNGIYAPVVGAVHSVVIGEMTTEEMMESFLSRETKHERD
ncbi:MAG: glycerol-3-phosphate dehydrogenase [Nocardioidaceae bacterium]|jgi:glycerol-3-phosphate dehydrogenase (NAD(P)+)|nr:glycerol-3-phosphate dehydrogenase [Nocardioidaceae bacterium]